MPKPFGFEDDARLGKFRKTIGWLIVEESSKTAESFHFSNTIEPTA
jgi:hypothetical protein